MTKFGGELKSIAGSQLNLKDNIPFFLSVGSMIRSREYTITYPGAAAF